MKHEPGPLAGDDTLYGYRGNDLLEGGDGNDVLVGGPDADRLLVGNGIDTASYAGAATSVVASLANPLVNTADGQGRDLFVCRESWRLILCGQTAPSGDLSKRAVNHVRRSS
ncbi:hypothetical protein [Shinella sp. M31]|uniref:hypothetical protein n=1 Tax=Shinella sp. M31 TaxID=3368615 RepID=UPI003B9DF2E7